MSNEFDVTGFIDAAEVERLRRIEKAALAYVREEIADDQALAQEGGGLHELATALGLR